MPLDHGGNLYPSIEEMSGSKFITHVMLIYLTSIDGEEISRSILDDQVVVI